MKIAIGCDHAAFEEKKIIIDYIESNFEYQVIDLGCHSSDSVDYPEYGHLVGKHVASGKSDKGIILCGSGLGISIAANKINGIRAALCLSTEYAEISRKHNDSNILALGARFVDIDNLKSIIDVWFTTKFEGGRHLTRINKIELT